MRVFRRTSEIRGLEQWATRERTAAVKDNGVSTENYQAPERRSGVLTITPFSDMWSLGRTLRELNNTASDSGPSVSDSVSDALQGFVEQCLRDDPESRPSAQCLLQQVGNVGRSSRAAAHEENMAKLREKLEEAEAQKRAIQEARHQSSLEEAKGTRGLTVRVEVNIGGEAMPVLAGNSSVTYHSNTSSPRRTKLVRSPQSRLHYV